MNVSFSRSFSFVALSLITSLSFTSTSYATVVGAQAFGDDMAGGTITVTYTSGAMRTQVINAGAPGQGFVNDPGFFDFDVTGDTFLSDWKLTNLNDEIITLVEFDLSNSNSLFDSGGLPDTPFGYAGRAGAVPTNAGAPTITNSFESDPWTDPMNLGDEYLKETIEYFNQDFRIGQTSTWRDDTDIIGTITNPETPEPTTLTLVLLGGLGLVARRR